MIRKLVNTNNEWHLATLRVVLGVVFLAHGLKKTIGSFGGEGFSVTMNGFTHGAHHFPVVLAFLAIMAEFLGGMGLILGALTRVAALGILCDMLVALVTVNSRFGFFINWSGKQRGEGYEFHLLVIAIALVLLSRGAGAWSIDRVLAVQQGLRLTASRGSDCRIMTS